MIIDLSDRSGTRFGIRDLVRLESDLASDQVPDLAPDQLPDLVQDVAPDVVPIRASSVRNVVANRIFYLGRDPERCHRSGARSDLVPGLSPDFVSNLLRTLAWIEKKICWHILHQITYQNRYQEYQI